LNASTVLMSGFGAPLRIATPIPTCAIGARDESATLPCVSELIEQGFSQDNRVERFVAVDSRFKLRAGADRHVDLVAGRLLELGTEVAHHRIERIAFE
jgi:hypothetical protein